MIRKLLPLIGVIPIGIGIGLLAASENWSTSTRLLITGVIAVMVVSIGAPIALLQRRRPSPLPPPASGQARLGAYELRGVFSENPVSPPGEFPRELSSGPRSPATALLPMVPRGWEPDRVEELPQDLMDRAVFVHGRTDRDVHLEQVPDDLLIWPAPKRRRHLRWRAARAYLRLRSVERLRSDAYSEVPDPSSSRDVDPATV